MVQIAVTVFADIRTDLEQTPTDRVVLIRAIWNWDNPPLDPRREFVTADHYREYMTTAGELLAVLTGANIPRPAIKMKVVNATQGLRRRAKPVDGEVLEVVPNGTILDFYDDSKTPGWAEVISGGWMSTVYLQRVSVVAA